MIEQKNPYDIKFGGVRKVAEKKPVLDEDGECTYDRKGDMIEAATGKYLLAGHFDCRVGKKNFVAVFDVNEEELRLNCAVEMSALSMKSKEEVPQAVGELIMRKAELAQEDLLFEIRRWEAEVAKDVIEQSREDANDG
jgi:hypothetical protein